MSEKFSATNADADVILLVRTQAEAEIFMAHPELHHAKILLFKPRLKLFLGSSFSYVGTEVYNNYAHARTVAAQKKIISSFDAPHDVEKQAAKYIILYLANLYYRITYTVRGFKSFYLFSGGKFHPVPKKEFVESVYAYFWKRRKQATASDISFVYRKITDFYNHSLARYLLGKNYILVTAGKRPVPISMAKSCHEQNPDYRIVYLKETKNKLETVMRNYIKFLRHRNDPSYEFILLAYPSRTKADLGFVPVSQVTELAIPLLSQVAGYAKGYHMTAARFFKIAAPKVVITDYLNFGSSLSYSAAARDKGALVFLINHGSHTIVKGVVAYAITNNLAHTGMLVSDYADYLIVRNPAASEFIRKISPESKQLPAKFSKPVKKTKNEFFNILHAGSYTEWEDHMPWVSETMEEYIENIKLIISALKGMDVRLIVRLRRRPELNAAILQKLLGENENVIIKDAGHLEDDLAMADLLISYNSAVIYQAAESGIPFLAYGRAANSNNIGTKLKEMVRRVRADAEAEVDEQLLWSSDVPDLNQLAEKVLTLVKE